jgi:hypothetical protein
MKVQVTIRRDVALRNGSDKHGDVLVDVPAESLTPEQRETLIAANRASRLPGADYALSEPSTGDLIVNGTADEVRTVLDSVAVEIQQTKAKKDAERAAAIAKLLAATDEEWINDRNTPPSLSFWVSGVRQDEYDSVPAVRERIKAVQPALDAARRQYEERQREYAADQARRKAESEQRDADGKQALKAWAMDNGSDLLKARVDGGYDWTALARNEWIAAQEAALGMEEAEDLLGDNDGKIESRNCPTLEEIVAMKSLLSKLPEGIATARLVWVKYVEPRDEEYYEDNQQVESRCEIEVEWRTPDHYRMDRYYLPESVTVNS